MTNRTEPEEGSGTHWEGGSGMTGLIIGVCGVYCVHCSRGLFSGNGPILRTIAGSI